MIIPESMLEKQLCSKCKKYLSVDPIKVYPNREVKCGRCSKENDKGVKSALYHVVVKSFKFPCINRYDGCDGVFPVSSMVHHERICHGGVYDCFLCNGFKGIAYDLNLHCQERHQKETLQNSEFLIDLVKTFHNDLFFYRKATRLFFIHYIYDPDEQTFTLDVIFIGNRYKGSIYYSLRLYSTQRKLIYTVKPSLCSIMELKLGSTAVVNMTPKKFTKKLAICQYFIHEEPEYICRENIPVIDSSFDACVLKCAFKNFHTIDCEGRVIFPAVYYFKDIGWKVYIKRKLSIIDQKRKFGVYLQWQKSKEDMVEPCKVSATFSLLSSDFKHKISKSFVERKYGSEYQSHGLMLADWNYIMTPASGFFDNHCINIEVEMKIYLNRKTEIRCIDCNKNCIYCN